MQVSQDHAQQLLQTQKIAPHLIQASEMLQCSTQELVQVIEKELMENPALEAPESAAEGCVECPKSLALCSNCPRRMSGETPFASLNDPQPPESETGTEVEPADDKHDDDYYDYSAAPDTEEYFDPITLKPSTTNLRDHLMTGIRSMACTGPVLRTAEYLINYLDDRGWLKFDEEEAMTVLEIDRETLEQAIQLLHTSDPPGVGARDLRECLLIQLRFCSSEGRGNALAEKLVEEHWESLSQRRYDQTARKLRKTREEIEAAISFIQKELTPDPAAQYRQPWEYKPDTRSEIIRPDVIVRRTQTGFEVEVASLNFPALNVSRRYRRLYEMIKAPGSSANDKSLPRMSPVERRHIIQNVERADIFMKNLLQRRKTIEKITHCLIEAQQGFIETGSRTFLLPLTRTEIARRTGLHESTVSRALLHKYIQLPSQEVVTFESFFASAGSAKEAIAALIADESPDHPLSDENLRQELNQMGVQVARRTIVKYREALRIPASYLRRKR